jgi:hypothetical protein
MIGQVGSAAGVLAYLGEDDAAARLVGVVDTLGGSLFPPRDRERIQLARERLGGVAFAAQAAIGAAWSEEEAAEQICTLLEDAAARNDE